MVAEKERELDAALLKFCVSTGTGVPEDEGISEENAAVDDIDTCAELKEDATEDERVSDGGSCSLNKLRNRGSGRFNYGRSRLRSEGRYNV